MGSAGRRHVPIDTGGVVGRYVLGKRLGAGGMGVVYEAMPAEGEPVAIKVPYCETLDDHHAASRFRDEGIAGSIVEHPNLARVQGRGETETGVPYIVMRRITGERLPLRVRREGLLPVRRAAQIVRQILDALAALHAAGIVHADVKSDNVLVHDEGRREIATLIDFGLAHAELDPAQRRREDGLVSGTPDYMAPEVIRGEGSTQASDIYAAGVILYELITGTTPFGGGSSIEIVHRHLEDDVVPPSLRRPERDIPPILERIVMRALAKNPARRFPSAAAFASALAVALPCLDDDVARPCAPAFATEAPTIVWTRRRQLARGTSRRRRR